MLRGQCAVFLSCSEKFKGRVAKPIREALRPYNVLGVIVSEEPLLPGTASDPNSKVESYLDASDAFVALCTPDNQLDDGTMVCRQNIIDEIPRAMGKPHLRERIQVFKERTVRLPSNINPTYEPLDLENVASAADRIHSQLASWGVLDKTPQRKPAPSPMPPESIHALIHDLKLGDDAEATRRAYAVMERSGKHEQQLVVNQIAQFLHDADSDDNHEVFLAGSLLEAIGRLDPSLIRIELVEELAKAQDFTKRSIAATLLWDRAVVAPAEVPLGLLGRLAVPSREDWYVQAPAMAAVKQLLLHRRSASIIFDNLSSSSDPEDRYQAAAALLDVAKYDVWAVPRNLAERLAGDSDRQVAIKGREVLKAIGNRQEEKGDPLKPFGL
ncbi:MAG TPA: TIR domain-containing protein [Chloroflexota bacterium]|nr:TIR domain-containing protein [Chloroflexota bacterium]